MSYTVLMEFAQAAAYVQVKEFDIEEYRILGSMVEWLRTHFRVFFYYHLFYDLFFYNDDLEWTIYQIYSPYFYYAPLRRVFIYLNIFFTHELKILIFLCLFVLFLSLISKSKYFYQKNSNTYIFTSYNNTNTLYYLLIFLFALVFEGLAKFILANASDADMVEYKIISYNNLFSENNYAMPLLSIILFFSILWFISILPVISKKTTNNIIIYYLFIILASICLLRANNWLVFYISLEIQALAIYILIALNNKSYKETESSLKYFIIGSLASILILYGVSFLYYSVGTLYFNQTQWLLYNLTIYNNHFILVGVGLILVGFFIKLGLVPFHGWLPDVYGGAPLYITNFLSTLMKFIMLLIFFRLSFNILSNSLLYYFQSIFYWLGLISVIFSTVAALGQFDLKRLLAFSGISHTGSIFILFSLMSYSGLKTLYVYLVLYFLITLGIFASLSLASYNLNNNFSKIFDLKSLYMYNPVLAVVIFSFIFSLMGLPPFVGFLLKFYLLQSLLLSKYVGTAVIIVICSLLSAFYYLRLIKVLFFDKNNIKIPSKSPISHTQFSSSQITLTTYLISLLAILNVLLIFRPAIILLVGEFMALLSLLGF